MEPYRILLADDHVLFREAMRKAIGDTEGLAVVGGVDDGLELMEFLKHTLPDLIILDLTMPNLSGLEAAREIKKLYPEVKILILSMHKSKGCLKGAFGSALTGICSRRTPSRTSCRPSKPSGAAKNISLPALRAR